MTDIAYELALAALEQTQGLYIRAIRKQAALLLQAGSTSEEIEPLLRQIDLNERLCVEQLDLLRELTA